MSFSMTSSSNSIFNSSVLSLNALEGSGDSRTASRFFRRSITSAVSPPMICRVPSVLCRLCQMLTAPAVATPPKQFCFSMTATCIPRWAARTAAKTPVQLPPTTTTSVSCTTGMDRAGSLILCILASLCITSLDPLMRFYRSRYQTRLHPVGRSNDLRPGWLLCRSKAPAGMGQSICRLRLFPLWQDPPSPG